jgi:DNA repair protein RecN (Recombination protein N)
LLEFQKNEIRTAQISPDEDTTLEAEQTRLKNSETLLRAVHESFETLYDAQGAVAEQLGEIKKNIERASQIDARLTPHADKIADVSFQVEDIAGGLRDYLDSLSTDEDRLEEVEARLDDLNKLKRKYGGSIESLFAHLAGIEKELVNIENLVDEIDAAEKKLSAVYEKIVGLTVDLSKKRKSIAKKMAKKVEQELAFLKMDGTKFQVDLRPIPADSQADTCLRTNGNAITESGTDRAAFMIAPNVGEALKPLANTASGGELSRVVLALKAILAKTESLETIVFDEVDAGIGGGVAETVGKKLYALSRFHQVICITHLPQIAKYGDHHFKISKYVTAGRTRTTIKPLSRKARVSEIARMLGGEKITQTTLDHASEMLEEIG